MSTGNLTGKRVAGDFWPGCRNCAYHGQCLVAARHPAFPHDWHWGQEQQLFPDGSKLVLESWVGTIAIGEAHTGCYDYQVDPGQLLPLAPEHEEYLTLSAKIKALNRELDNLEEVLEYRPELYDELEALLAERDAIPVGLAGGGS